MLAALVTLGLLAGLFAAHRRRHLPAASITALLALAVAWVLAKLAYAADYRDADGYVDCWPSCSALQQAVAAGLYVAPLSALVVALVTLAAYGLRK